MEELVIKVNKWWRDHNDVPHTGPHHSEDYFTHCRNVAVYVAKNSDDNAVLIAALLHDVAKPRCHIVNKKGGNSFYAHGGHQNLSEEEIDYFLGERKDNPICSEALELVHYHMDMFFDPEDDVKCAKIQEIKAEKGDNFFKKLCLINEADIASSVTDNPNEPIYVRLAKARSRGFNL